MFAFILKIIYFISKSDVLFLDGSFFERPFLLNERPTLLLFHKILTRFFVLSSELCLFLSGCRFLKNVQWSLVV